MNTNTNTTESTRKENNWDKHSFRVLLSLLVFLAFLFSLVESAPISPIQTPETQTTVEISENGYVNWIKIPKTERIHVIINEGKLVSVRPL